MRLRAEHSGSVVVVSALPQATDLSASVQPYNDVRGRTLPMVLTPVSILKPANSFKTAFRTCKDRRRSNDAFGAALL